MKVKDYIQQHDEFAYCEAIIYPNGDIEDAIPGHTYKLMSITDKSQKELNEIMPFNASPLHWLTGYTKCVAIWYNFFIYDSLTEEQLNTIQELVNHGLLINGVSGRYTDEFSRCDLLTKFYKGEIGVNEIPDRPQKIIRIWRNENV